MSDLKDVDPEKQEKLKAIIGRLHAGESAGRVKKVFDELVKDVSAEEIAAMEQALMKAGMPAEEIQRLCEVHVEVFENTLEAQGKPDKVPGHPVHTFMAENDAARASLKRLKRAAFPLRFPWSRNKAAADATAKALVDFRRIVVHYTRKENQLFPYLEAKGFDAPSKVMWGKHDEVRALFKEADEAVSAADYGRLARIVSSLAGKASRMFFMEERILLPTSLRKLDERDWIAIRRGEPSIGYAWVTPGGAWDPDIAEAKLGPTSQPAAAPPKSAYAHEAPAADAARKDARADSGRESPGDSRGMDAAGMDAAGMNAAGMNAAPVPEPKDMPGALRLGEGWMPLESIDLMLKTLPVDVSFVDEHNRVLYYSDGKERIFPRSPAVIGRDVHNCHPPKSVAVVERILEAFRKKEKDTAEFWIEMGGKFIHIRYFAVYGKDGAYKGTLEVSQDVTAIRALQGQRRLLDWI